MHLHTWQPSPFRLGLLILCLAFFSVLPTRCLSEEQSFPASSQMPGGTLLPSTQLKGGALFPSVQFEVDYIKIHPMPKDAQVNDIEGFAMNIIADVGGGKMAAADSELNDAVYMLPDDGLIWIVNYVAAYGKDFEHSSALRSWASTAITRIDPCGCGGTIANRQELDAALQSTYVAVNDKECNIVVGTVAYKMGYKGFGSPGSFVQANSMFLQMVKCESVWKELRDGAITEQADLGHLVVGAMQDQPNGHVFVVLPGSTYTPDWSRLYVLNASHKAYRAKLTHGNNAVSLWRRSVLVHVVFFSLQAIH